SGPRGGAAKSTRSLVALFLIEADQSNSVAEQAVDRRLDICPHVTGKLADRRHESAARNAGKVPVQDIAGIVELFFRFIGLVFRRTVAIAAQPNRTAPDPHAHLTPRPAAKLASRVDGLESDPQAVAFQRNALLCRFEQGIGDSLRIGPQAAFSFSIRVISVLASRSDLPKTWRSKSITNSSGVSSSLMN